MRFSVFGVSVLQRFRVSGFLVIFGRVLGF